MLLWYKYLVLITHHPLKQKVAIVTGSSRGIGAGIAQYLMKKGFFVYVTFCTNKKAALSVCKKKKSCRILKLDLRKETDIKKCFDIIKKEHGYLDLLVNNANIETPGTTEEIDIDVWKEIFSIRVYGTFLTTKYAIPLLKKSKRSVIVNISSSLPIKGRPKYPAHTAAEAAIMSYTRTCAIDLARYGIRCHTVNPTMTRTDMWKDIGGYEDDEMWKRFAKENPLGRVGTPEDIGKAVYLLTTDETEYWNANEIYVNGGLHMK